MWVNWNLISFKEVCCRWFRFLPEQAGKCALAWTGSAEKKNGGVRWSEQGCGSVRRAHPSVLWSDDVGALRLERRHGFCTAAYPSWSRTSSPPGWFGRALKMKGDRQIAETRAAMSHLSGAEVSLNNCLLIYSTAVFVFIQVQSFSAWHWTGLVGGGGKKRGRGERERPQGRVDQSNWLTAQTKHVSCQL